MDSISRSLLALVCIVAVASTATAAEPVDFAHDVQPILAKHCFECHGPDTQESRLRLDVRDWVLRGGESGEPAIIPRDAGNSHLVKLVSSRSEQTRMPPGGPALSSDEIGMLTRWIDQGAPWPDELAGRDEPVATTTTHW
ncbi:MAG TPA: c-type cytochrome domain-containing protein, partial [Pirellulales bacterium]|nr:c-type cytochrome domain-containing protein [Pirellulales bacterium]